MKKTYTVLMDEDMGFCGAPIEMEMTWNEIMDKIDYCRKYNRDFDLRQNQYGYDFHFIIRLCELIPTVKQAKRKNFFQRLFCKG